MRGFKGWRLLLVCCDAAGAMGGFCCPGRGKTSVWGQLRVAIAGDPPSLDMHQESTFHGDDPLFSRVQHSGHFDPHGYPKVIGDLAKSWTVSDDQMTYTFTLHQGVKFHDGSDLTSADVKASWDRIVSPPEGVVSPRKTVFQFIKSVEAPDPRYRGLSLALSFSVVPSMASPIRQTSSMPKSISIRTSTGINKTTMGSGPFKFKHYVRGSTMEVERNPNYWKKGLPYMDGIKYYMIKDDGARAKSIRSDRTDVEFRGFAPVEAGKH